MSGRFRILAAGLAVLAVAAPAWADAPAVCETPKVAVYFLHGETSPTDGAREILAMAGEAAAQCDAALVGVTARFDPATEGDLDLALKRLAAVADQLASRGVPLNRIHVVAQPADASNPAQGPGRIEIRVSNPDVSGRGARPQHQDRTPANLA